LFQRQTYREYISEFRAFVCALGLFNPKDRVCFQNSHLSVDAELILLEVSLIDDVEPEMPSSVVFPSLLNFLYHLDAP